MDIEDGGCLEMVGWSSMKERKDDWNWRDDGARGKRKAESRKHD